MYLYKLYIYKNTQTNLTINSQSVAIDHKIKFENCYYMHNM